MVTVLGRGERCPPSNSAIAFALNRARLASSSWVRLAAKRYRFKRERKFGLTPVEESTGHVFLI